MAIDERRQDVVRDVATQHGLDPQLLLDLIGLEAEHTNLHAYGARGRMRRAAENLIDAAFGHTQASDEA